MKTLNIVYLLITALCAVVCSNTFNSQAKIIEADLATVPACTRESIGDLLVGADATKLRVCDENRHWNLIDSYVDVGELIQTMDCDVEATPAVQGEAPSLRVRYFWVEFVASKHLFFCDISEISTGKTLFMDGHFAPEGVFEPPHCHVDAEDSSLSIFPVAFSKKESELTISRQGSRVFINQAYCKHEIKKPKLVGLPKDEF